jgi:hypothetical protein
LARPCAAVNPLLAIRIGCIDETIGVVVDVVGTLFAAFLGSARIAAIRASAGAGSIATIFHSNRGACTVADQIPIRYLQGNGKVAIGSINVAWIGFGVRLQRTDIGNRSSVPNARIGK